MSRFISEILQASEPSFSHGIQELEALAGRPGVDIKLAYEMKQLFRQKAKDLGLDENDTTAAEIYHALSKQALADSDKLADIIGVKTEDSPKIMIEKSIAYAQKRLGKRLVWSLKASTARKQLKDNPPRRLMKIWNIRSIDSALKREHPSVFYCFTPRAESSAWTTKYIAQAGKLTNSDFDYQLITISLLSESKKTQLEKTGLRLNHITYAHHETASIEVVPLNRRFEGDVLFVVDSLFNHVKDILRLSAYIKHQGFHPDFFSKVERIRAEGLGSLEVTGYPFGWNTRLYAASELGVSDLVSSGSDTGISAEDLLMPSLQQLAQLDTWKHPFALHLEPGVIISSNLSDMIINAVNKVPADKAYVDNGRENLRQELFARYLKHHPVQKRFGTL